MNTNNSKRLKNRKLTFIVLILICIGIAGFIFKRDVSVKYYDLANNHYKEGDKIYLSKLLMDAHNDGHHIFSLYRLIRPITEKDIEEMDIDKLEKETLKNKIDPSLKSYLIKAGKDIVLDTLYKCKSAFIGTFLYHKVLNFQGSDNGKLFFDNAYALLPGYKGFEADILDNSDDYLLPSNYTWADDAYYFPALWTSDNEYQGFK